MEQKLRVALLAGGKSGERDVSLKGASGVEKALDSQKYDVQRYDPATDLPKLAADAINIDFAFILLHGPFGEDGTMQGMLDLLEIPYQGAGVLGSAMAMDKNVAKIMYQRAGLTVPDWVMVTRGQAFEPDEIIDELGLPLVIKPLQQGSSLGMSMPETIQELVAGVEDAFRYDKEVMIEQYIGGREITVGVIGNDDLTTLPLVEIVPGDSYAFFDYEAKYQPGATEEICPAQVDADITKQAQDWALKAHRILHLEGYSRTDMIIDQESNNLYVLETNTIPGMTPTSLLPQAANEYGLSFSGLLDRLIELGLQAHKK